MKVYDYSRLSGTQVSNLCRRNPVGDPDLLQVCSRIFSAVEEKGDDAVREYTLRFDGAEIGELRVSRTEFESALGQVSPVRLEALQRAASNIRAFHAAQGLREGLLEVEPGIACWREPRPIERVGLYVPGGTAVLPSTVLMLGVPAVLAGCLRVALCTPPRPDGSVTPEVLAAASIAGIHEVFRIGGAQAIAALCLGASSVPRVDKILGPGSPVVQTAKLLAQQQGVAIDMVAGPSEVLVVADDTARPGFVAGGPHLPGRAWSGQPGHSGLTVNRADRWSQAGIGPPPRGPPTTGPGSGGSGIQFRSPNPVPGGGHGVRQSICAGAPDPPGA